MLFFSGAHRVGLFFLLLSAVVVSYAQSTVHTDQCTIIPEVMTYGQGATSEYSVETCVAGEQQGDGMEYSASRFYQGGPGLLQSGS